MGFKLIAIRPLKRCGSIFLKNLQINRIYKFYDNFEFYNNQIRIDNSFNIIEYRSVNRIIEREILHKDFFNSKINISAIIGKNGSGKSTLIDLFIASINQISLNLKKNDVLNTTAELETTKTQEGRLVHCELYYEINKSFFQIIIDDLDITFNKLDRKSKFDIKHFFYSEIISYSIYAFNSWEVGDWIDHLFHKNDSYQIPVVINPKRESKEDGLAGIIDVNTESDLLQQRLLAIILENVKLVITDNLTAYYLKLNLKESRNFFVLNDRQVGSRYEEEEKIKSDFYNLLNSDIGVLFNMNNTRTPSTLYKDLNLVLKEFKIKYQINEIDIPNIQYRIDIYILYKIISICEKYVGYNDFIKILDKKKGIHAINIKAFLKKFEKSQSHINFKLKQVVNFIKNYENIWQKYVEKDYVNIKKLSSELKSITDKNNPLIELLPPPIFKTTLFSKNKIDLLSSISSGERQLVHSISTVIYHLTNLNSVEKDDLIVKYNYVNIILDEIELYFHPEFQKQFIKRLVDEITKLKLKDIKGINVLIVSHSPFILSDIPKQNVLFLEKGQPVSLDRYRNTNTFGANISNLLSDSFFIGDGLIGEFAKSKITETIEWLNEIREEYLKKENNNPNKFSANSRKKEYHKSIIDIIDEPIIKSKLIEMYSEVFGNEERKKYLREEMRKIEDELRELEN